jgi:hypothetical protein
MPRESIETDGLVVIRHSTGLTPQGRARDAAGLPTGPLDEGPTEQRFELEGQTETRQSVVRSMRREAEACRPAVCELLQHWADRVEQIEETVGELLARTGLEEGDAVVIRFPTVQEDRAKLAAVIAQEVVR